jgi:hypothetical protein
MRFEIIQDDDLARPQAGSQDLGDIGAEDISIRAALHRHGGSNPFYAQGPDKGQSPPPIARSRGAGAVPPRSPGVESGQIDMGARLIDKD